MSAEFSFLALQAGHNANFVGIEAMRAPGRSHCADSRQIILCAISWRLQPRAQAHRDRKLAAAIENFGTKRFRVMESRAGDGPKLSGDEENLRQYECDNQNMQHCVFRDRRAHGRGTADPYATEVPPIGAAAGRRRVAETAQPAGLFARTWLQREPDFIN